MCQQNPPSRAMIPPPKTSPRSFDICALMRPWEPCSTFLADDEWRKSCCLFAELDQQEAHQILILFFSFGSARNKEKYIRWCEFHPFESVYCVKPTSIASQQPVQFKNSGAFCDGKIQNPKSEIRKPVSQSRVCVHSVGGRNLELIVQRN